MKRKLEANLFSQWFRSHFLTKLTSTQFVKLVILPELRYSLYLQEVPIAWNFPVSIFKSAEQRKGTKLFSRLRYHFYVSFT